MESGFDTPELQGHFMPNEQIFFQNYIVLYFNEICTVVDLNGKTRMQKNVFEKLQLFTVL